MKQVLVTATNYSALCPEGKALLEEAGYRVLENDRGRPLTFQELQEVVGEVDAVVAGVDTWDEKVFALAPRLRVIARFGVGVDNIDCAAAAKHSIVVTNCRGVNANSVAEQGMALLLAVVRQVPQLFASTREGGWDRTIFRELGDMTLGLLGFGAIGVCMARRAAAFGMKLIAYDPYPNETAAKELGVQFCTVEDLFAEADAVSLHLPSTPQTFHTMDEKAFAAMKQGSYLINTARGALVDEKALYDALKSGHLAGAAVDVYEKEPVDAGNPLFTLPNFIGTPHSAAESYRVYRDCGFRTALAILRVMSGEEPADRCN